MNRPINNNLRRARNTIPGGTVITKCRNKNSPYVLHTSRELLTGIVEQGDSVAHSYELVEFTMAPRQIERESYHIHVNYQWEFIPGDGEIDRCTDHFRDECSLMGVL